MVRPLALALALALALPILGAGEAQVPPSPLDPIIADVEKNRTRASEVVLGPELSRENVRVQLDMEFRDVDFDTLKVIFGGGKFSATARVQARIDMRVLAADRVEQAVEGAIPGSTNLTTLAGSEAQFIPADVFRASLAGEALAAFQDEQEERLADFLAETIPNVTVLATRFEWSNVSPQDSLEADPAIPRAPPNGGDDLNDPTFPPITLDATVDVQYLERTSLLDILDKALQPKSEREKERKARVADAAASYERSAFGLLGIRQVLDLEAFSGWDLVVRVTLPQGYTFEEASPDVLLDPGRREAEVLTLGREAGAPVVNPVSLTLSNRFLVSTALLAAVLLCGAILRLPVILGVNVWRRKMRT